MNLTADVIGDCEAVCSSEAPIAADADSASQSETGTGNLSVMAPTPAPIGPVSDHIVELETSSLTIFRARPPVSSASISNCVDWLHVPVRILLMPKSAVGTAEEIRPLPSFYQLPIPPTYQPVEGTLASNDTLSRVTNFA